MGQHLTHEEKNTYRIGASVIDVSMPPETWKFTLEDVRAVLQHLRRYLGGSERSVWEHSADVGALAFDRMFEWCGGSSYHGVREEVALLAYKRGLWHDASEAFTGDVPGPIKQHLGIGFRIFEDKIQEVVYKLAGCSTQEIVAKYGTEVHNAICEAVSWADAEDYRSEQQTSAPDVAVVYDCRLKETPMQAQADQPDTRSSYTPGEKEKMCPGKCGTLMTEDYIFCWPCFDKWKSQGCPEGPDGPYLKETSFAPVFDEGRSADSPPEGAVSSTTKPELPEEEVEESMPYDVLDLLAHHDTLTAEAYELMQRKNNDYAGAGGASPFKNFLHAETLGLCTVEQGMVVRLSDKLQRLAHFVSGQEMQVKDEAMRDTILDIINYAVLISAYTQAKKDGVL